MALNPYLAAKLKTANLGPEMIPLLVEVESPQVASDLAKIMGLGGATIKVGRTIGLPGTTQYIEVSAPVESLAAIEQTPGVKMVHKNMIKKIKRAPSVLNTLMTKFDPIEGEVSIDDVILPRQMLGPAMAFRYSPLGLLTRTPLGKIGPLARMSPLGEITIIPTSKSRLVLLDVPSDYDGSGITVAVLDTGSGPQLPQSLGVFGYSACQVDPLPTDQHGHGCLSGDAVVFTGFCGLATLEEIWNKVEAEPMPYKDGEAKFFNTKTLGYEGLLKAVDTNAIFRTTCKESIEITTRLGVLPPATPWHEFYVVHRKKVVGNKNRLGRMDWHPRWYNGYEIEKKRADEIRPGDYLFTPRFNTLPVQEGEHWVYPYVVAYVLGDGNIRPYADTRHSDVGITDEDTELLQGVADRIKKLGYEPHIDGNHLCVYSADFKRRLEALGIPSGVGKSRTFRLPRILIKTSDAARAFVAGYYDAEGNPYYKNKGLYFCISSVNRPFLEEMQLLLLNFGIYGYIGSGGISKGSKSYHLLFGPNSARDFAEFIRPYALKPIPVVSDNLQERSKGCVTLENGRAIKVYKVERKDAKDFFYSLSIPDLHNYVTSGVYSKNSWCLTAATGRKAKGIFGEVQGVAPGAEQMPIKVLQSLTGMGMTSDILAGIQMAVNKGARVISMSLGSDTCEGGCYESDGGPCPECKLIKELSDQGILFVIAAGNSGTDPEDSWQIGCPGCSQGTVTVASLSMTDAPSVAYWSSRGPSNITNQGKSGYELKPNVAAPGGGRASSKASPDEVIYSGMGGYFTGLYTGTWADIAGNFHGTSQATPAVAGLLAVLLQAGKISDARDFKAICARMGHPYQPTDGYGVPKLSWF